MAGNVSNESKTTQNKDAGGAVASSTAGRVQCTVCNKSLSSKGSLRSHMNIHRAKRYRCKLCATAFVRLDTLKRHMNTHSALKQFLCERCGELFSHIDSLRSHRFYVHCDDTAVGRHQCSVCSKTLGSAVSLKRHALGHVRASSFCSLCDKPFMSEYGLARHQAAAHDGHTLIYSCAKCRAMYVDGAGVAGDAAIPGKNVFHINQGLGGNVRCVACGLCAKPFQQHAAGRDRVYPCDKCPERFGTYRQLYKHEIWHRTRFPCDACGKKFNSKDGLAIHRRTHTGERPFACGMCTADFSSVFNIFKHQQMIHDKDTKCSSIKWRYSQGEGPIICKSSV